MHESIIWCSHLDKLLLSSDNKSTRKYRTLVNAITRKIVSSSKHKRGNMRFNTNVILVKMMSCISSYLLHSPLGTQILSFSCSLSGKFGKIVCLRPPGELAPPPPGEILDPPLSTLCGRWRQMQPN